jgi:hypothetical protein
MKYILLFFISILFGCKTTVKSGNVEIRSGFEECGNSLGYYKIYYLKNKSESGFILPLYSHDWKVFYTNNNLAAKCIVSPDSNCIYQYDIQGKLILKEIRTKNGNKVECY